MTTFTHLSPSCQIPCLNEFYERYFPGERQGTFVDVGAFDGYQWSNTWGLAQVGWRGLCFEPVPEWAAKCKLLYARLPVVTVQAAVGAQEGRATLYTSGNPTINLETVQKGPWGFGYDKTQTLQVPLTTLDAALPFYEIPPDFEVLSIDVEGAELEVLAGLDLDLWHPRMVILETCKAHDTPSFHIHTTALAAVMQAAGYIEIYFDHINSIYVRSNAANRNPDQSAEDYQGSRPPAPA